MGGYDSGRRRIWASQGFRGGLVTSVPAHLLEGDESPDAENFDPSFRFGLKKRLGSTSYTGTHGSPTGTIVRGLDSYTFENGTIKDVAKEGTAVYDISAGNWATTITGHPAISDGDEVHFKMFKNVIIMTSEEAAPIAPQKWSGSGAFSSLGGSPPAAQYPVVHKGRLWLLSTAADPSRGYFSAINNHEDWSTADNAGDIFFNPGDGMVINGAISDGEVLYVSKKAKGSNEGAIYALFGTGPTDFQAPRRIAYFGAVSQRALALTKSFAVVASHQGVYGLQGNRLIKMSKAVDKTLFDLTAAQRTEMAVGRFADQIEVAYPASGATNTKSLVTDLEDQIWGRYSNRTARIYATRPDGSLLGASASATVRVLKFNTGADDIGSAITMTWNTPDIDFGEFYSDKHWMQSFLHVASQAVTWTMTYTINGAASGDSSQTMVGNTEGPVKRIVGKGAATDGRFFRFQISEANATLSGEGYGIECEAEISERVR